MIDKRYDLSQSNIDTNIFKNTETNLDTTASLWQFEITTYNNGFNNAQFISGNNFLQTNKGNVDKDVSLEQ